MNIFIRVRRLIGDSVKVWLDLLWVMVPIVIGVKIAAELGVIEYLAIPLAPVMELVGLPANTGLVWAAAMLNNIYSGMIVYVSLPPETPTLSVAQVTVLCLMMLVAHSLPVEARVVQKCGAGFWSQFFFRMVSGLACGLVFHLIFSGFGLFQEPSAVLWKGRAADPSWWAWARGEALNLLMILAIITVMMALMRALNHFRITDLLIRLLRPVLRLLGIGENAATITIIGLTMGIAYGGGLILHEVKSGRLGRSDVFASVTFMGMSHAIIEDTLLMMMLGATAYGVFWGRLLFSLVVMAILARLMGSGFLGAAAWRRRFGMKD